MKGITLKVLLTALIVSNVSASEVSASTEVKAGRSTTTKVVAGTTAVAALAGLGYMFGGKMISAVKSVSMPKFSMPTMPQFSMPTVSMPQNKWARGTAATAAVLGLGYGAYRLFFKKASVTPAVTATAEATTSVESEPASSVTPEASLAIVEANLVQVAHDYVVTHQAELADAAITNTKVQNALAVIEQLSKLPVINQKKQANQDKAQNALTALLNEVK